MPQTLLAFAGILLLTTHAFSVQQWSIFSQRTNITRELSEMGGAVAVETMEVIRTRAFDRISLDGTATQSIADLNLFEYPFRTGVKCSVFWGAGEDCDDIDDFNEMQTALLPFVMASDTVTFAVDVKVYYVNDALNVVSGTTFNKKVIVSVRDEWKGGMQPFLASPIQLERVFSYGF